MSYAKAKRRNINTLPVIYVTDRKLCDVTAVFPTLPANPGRLLCYAHVGQHSECSEGWFRDCTRQARVDEYAGLHREVQGIYGRDPDPFELVIVKRITADMRAERRQNESPE